MKPAPTSILRPFEERLLAELQRLQRHAEQRAVRGAVQGAAADDLVQETLLRAWRGRASFDPERELWPWLRIVADNVASRRAEVEARQPALDRTAAVELEPEGAEHEREAPFDVRPFLEKLRPEERDVVERFYFGGLSIAEIALDRSCAEGTVKSQLSRARTRLAGMLAGFALGLGALVWWFWPTASVAPASARLAYHSLTVEHIEPEPPKLAIRDLSKTTRRGWTVVGAVTTETQDAPPGDE